MSFKDKDHDPATDVEDALSDEITNSARDQDEEPKTGHSKTEYHVRRTRSQEAVKTLLSSFGENVDRCSDEFANQDIKFRDLSALSDKDLIILGVAEPETQSVMLETFQELPNQDMHFDRFCATTEAQDYNEQILERAQSHLNSMNTSLSAAYLKMLVNPSNDVVIDESIFASRFVLEALDELKKTTDDMEDRLRVLEQIAHRNAKIQVATRTEKHIWKTFVILGGICTGVSIALWYWKAR